MWRLLLIVFFVTPALAAIPPLTEQDRAILEDVVDRTSLLDGAGVYPLLRNAMQWEADDRAGAMIPDYAQLHVEPGKYRGQLFLIEGAFAGKYRDLEDLKVGRLTRSGPWDDTLEQWPVVVVADADGNTHNDEVAIVWLVNPPSDGAGNVRYPKAGTPVQIVGRFYKVWRVSKLNQSDEADFLVFVGHSAIIDPHGTAGSSGEGLGTDDYLIVLLIVAAAGWFMLRVVTRRHRAGNAVTIQRRQQRRLERQQEDADDEDEIDEGPPLPPDPAAALDELERRRGSLPPQHDA